MRLNKYLALTGLFSRRGADEVIKSGRVKINGNLAVLGDQVDDNDQIQVDGKIVTLQPLKYLAYNKPIGLVATKEDESGRETIYTSGKIDKGLSYAGRLDMGSEGLMILSNDGDFINEITRPNSNIQKVYQLTLSGSPDNLSKLPEAFLQGIKIEDTLMKADKVIAVRPNVFDITLHQGYNRQLRKMSAQLNLGVVNLKRTQIGKLKVGILQPGEIIDIKPSDVI
jgi:pseudouridine synthase